MTPSETSWLERIELLLGNLAERQDRFQTQLETSQRQLEETRQIADSNAKAIATVLFELVVMPTSGIK
jgi:hypothetical protein